MKQFPDTPPVDDAPDRLLEGHLWLTEVVDGAPLRFQVRESGLVRFGDRSRVYDDPADVPESYQHAVRHVREHLDRDVLRGAVADPSDVVFFGVATHRHGIDYDWERLPAFLGTDVWSAEADAFRPPDAVEGIFERLGLEPVNAVERELPARDFDPDSYAVPESAWYDGPAAGVLVRNKRGDRAELRHPDTGTRPVDSAADASAADLAAEHATRDRLERIAAELDDRGESVTADSLAERAYEAVLREVHPLVHGDPGSVDAEALRGEVAALARQFLEDRPADAW